MNKEAPTSSARTATRVLFVEDEGLIANDIARRLKHAGYEVAGVAESGNEALTNTPAGPWLKANGGSIPWRSFTNRSTAPRN